MRLLEAMMGGEMAVTKCFDGGEMRRLYCGA